MIDDVSFKGDGRWALVLGGSSGLGYACALRLARAGLNICILHRDRRGAMTDIERHFELIRATGQRLVTYNCDASDPTAVEATLSSFAAQLAPTERVQVLIHAIAAGALKSLTPPRPDPRVAESLAELAKAVGVEVHSLTEAAHSLFAQGHAPLWTLAPFAVKDDAPPLGTEDMELTINAMGTSLLTWTMALNARGLFAAKSRILALTSEGNQKAWHGYGAVAAAKGVLEAVVRSIAVELAPFGIRANAIQAGVTDTAALAKIPGAQAIKARTLHKHPCGRLTTPEDVADAVYLLCREEAHWINGTVIRVDGGESLCP